MEPGNLRVRWVAPVLLALVLTGCGGVTVLESLDERQANEVVATLLRQNIEATKVARGKTGYAVTVDKRNLVQAIDLVRQHDLPRSVRSQVSEAFPVDAMVSTPLSERARLLSAIEQRLEESLGVLDGVRSARVHVSYDGLDEPGSVKQRSARPKHIAAVLVYEPGTQEQSLVQNSKRFLRNTFSDLSYDDISVVLTPAPATRVLAITPDQQSAGSALWLLGTGVLGLLAGAVWMTRSALRRVTGLLRLRLGGKERASGAV